MKIKLPAIVGAFLADETASVTIYRVVSLGIETAFYAFIAHETGQKVIGLFERVAHGLDAGIRL